MASDDTLAKPTSLIPQPKIAISSIKMRETAVFLLRQNARKPYDLQKMGRTWGVKIAFNRRKIKTFARFGALRFVLNACKRWTLSSYRRRGQPICPNFSQEILCIYAPNFFLRSISSSITLAWAIKRCFPSYGNLR